MKIINFYTGDVHKFIVIVFINTNIARISIISVEFRWWIFRSLIFIRWPLHVISANVVVWRGKKRCDRTQPRWKLCRKLVGKTVIELCFTQRYVHFSRFFPAQKNPQRTKNQFSTCPTHYTKDPKNLSCCCLISSPKSNPLTCGRIFGKNKKKKRTKKSSRRTEDKWDKKTQLTFTYYVPLRLTAVK